MRGSWRGRHPGTEVRRRSGCPRMIRRCSSAEFCYTNSCRFRVRDWWREFGSALLWEQDVAGSNPVIPTIFPHATLLTSEIASIGCRWLTKACIKQQFTQLLQTFAPLSPATRDASRFEDRTQALGPHEIVPADAHEPKPEIPYGILPLSLSFQNFGIILPVLQLAVEVDDDGAVVSKPPALEKAPEPAIASIEALLYGFRRQSPSTRPRCLPFEVENVDLQIGNFEAKFDATGDQKTTRPAIRPGR